MEEIFQGLLTDIEEDVPPSRHRGSLPGPMSNIDRNWEAFHTKFIQEYFFTIPTYTSHIFERLFRVTRDLFNDIVDKVSSLD